MPGLVSAAGLVGYLEEPDVSIQVYALQQLNDNIDNVWTEVVASLSRIETMYEDSAFPNRQLAALVAAKVFHQLQAYDESMVMALAAGKLFDPQQDGEFTETIVAKCIDTYIALSALRNPTSAGPSTETIQTSSANASSSMTPFSQTIAAPKSLLSRDYDASSSKGDANATGAHPAPQDLPQDAQQALENIMRKLFDSCYDVGAYKHVVGIAIEARNKDILREAILRCSQGQKSNGKASATGTPGQSEDIMEYVLDICMHVVQERGLRDEILQLILDMLSDIPSPDYFAITRCMGYLGKADMASQLLRDLVQKSDSKSLAIAYQLSFDLYENATQEFLSKVMEQLPADADVEESKSKNDTNGASNEDGPEATETTGLLSEHNTSTERLADRTKQQTQSEGESKAYKAIRSILQGTKAIELNVEFLFRNSRADRNVLNKIRDSLEARNSIFHTAITFANAFMNSGTTIDTFFRENLDWLGKAVNWSKFTATAALGVIHRGNLSSGQKLLEPYLPRDVGVPGSAYSQGGSLYALGLIYTNHGTHVLDYLREQFRNATEEVVQHGGALGLGVAGMATGSEAIYGELRQVLYSDSAINGEAVGLSMGLVMLGSGNVRALEDMIQYARETQHEKIVRGLALGMALIMYGRQEKADELINSLLGEGDPTLRYGGIMTVALAYCGSSSNKAVRKLLHVAVSDVSDDVRRVAVMALGFVLFRKPNSVPRMVELLSESYNPHVRYGATMALGIACAGTGLEEAIDLLEPMMKDSVDFVRQGALISLSMIMVQQNEVMNPKVGTIRKKLLKIVGDRHEDAVCKFGCALALGIIDAGGRNCTISLQTQTGNLNMTAIVGMAVFTQYWYWFPLTNFLSLAFTPTAVIGVDVDLEIPAFKIHSNTRPSLFDYPPEAEVKTAELPEKVKTAVLSTTAQAKRRKQHKEKQEKSEGMDVDTVPPTPSAATAADGEKMDLDTDENIIDTSKADVGKSADKDGEQAKTTETPRKKLEREKIGHDVDNMSRVLPSQLRYISFKADGRYQPVKKITGGVIVLEDTQPSEAKQLLELKAKKKRTAPAVSAPGALSGSAGGAEPSTPVRIPRDAEMSGTEAAAGVLTAVDEDGEGVEEAPCPDAFEVEDESDEGNDETQ